MPFIAPLILWVGVTFGVSATVAGVIVSTVLMTGLSFAIKGVESLFMKPASSASLANDAANHSVTSRQAAAPRRVVYGTDLVGGVYTFLAVSGTNSEYLQEVITFCGHPIDSYTQFLFENEVVPLDGSGNATGKYAGFVLIEQKLGTAGEAAFPGLMADMPTNWTLNHRQDGCASIHVRLKFDSSVLSSVPNIRALIKGMKLYDPRTGLTAWSDNPALVVRHYLADPSIGFGAKDAEIDDALIIAAANVCDELVAIHGSTTEKRYTCNGTFDLSENPQDVLTALVASMSGRCVWSGGKWRVYAGAWRPPVLAYGDDDLRDGDVAFQVRRSRRDRCNGVMGTFIDPTNQYQLNDFPAYFRGSNRGYAQDDFLISDAGIANFRGDWSLGLGAIAERDGARVTGGGVDVYYVCDVAHTASSDKQPGVGANWHSYWTPAERIWQNVELRFTKSSSMAQRLGKIVLEANRREISGVLSYKLGAYQSVPPDVVEISHDRFGWVDKTFEVVEVQLNFDDSSSASSNSQGKSVPVLAPNLSLSETDANIYAWSAADDLPPTVAAALPLPGTDNSTTTLGSLSATNIRAGVIDLTWVAPTDALALAGDNYVYFKLHSSGTWLQYSVVPGDQIFEEVGGLTSGVAYDFEVRNFNTDNRGGVPVTLLNYTAP